MLKNRIKLDFRYKVAKILNILHLSQRHKTTPVYVAKRNEIFLINVKKTVSNRSDENHFFLKDKRNSPSII